MIPKKFVRRTTMIRLYEFIREAGMSPEDYPNASQIPVTLYDRKDRLVENSTIHFEKNLFVNNEKSKLAFKVFLEACENNLPTAPISMKIDENAVVVYMANAKPQHFSRLPQLDPLDYMD